jgi:hypothetical protein
MNMASPLKFLNSLLTHPRVKDAMKKPNYAVKFTASNKPVTWLLKHMNIRIMMD